MKSHIYHQIVDMWPTWQVPYSRKLSPHIGMICAREENWALTRMRRRYLPTCPAQPPTEDMRSCQPAAKVKCGGNTPHLLQPSTVRLSKGSGAPSIAHCLPYSPIWNVQQFCAVRCKRTQQLKFFWGWYGCSTSQLKAIMIVSSSKDMQSYVKMITSHVCLASVDLPDLPSISITTISRVLQVPLAPTPFVSLFQATDSKPLWMHLTGCMVHHGGFCWRSLDVTNRMVDIDVASMAVPDVFHL